MTTNNHEKDMRSKNREIKRSSIPIHTYMSSKDKISEDKNTDFIIEFANNSDNNESIGDTFSISECQNTYTREKSIEICSRESGVNNCLIFHNLAPKYRYTISQLFNYKAIPIIHKFELKPEKKHRHNKSTIRLFKASFRECQFQSFDSENFIVENSVMPVKLDYVRNKWIYVFYKYSDKDEPSQLLYELKTDKEGNYSPVNFLANRENDIGKPIDEKANHLYLPYRIYGKRLDLYACISQIPFSWERIKYISQYPHKRCYKIGTQTGGLVHYSESLDGKLYEYFDSIDERINAQKTNNVIIGLYDYLLEAKKRSNEFVNISNRCLMTKLDFDPNDNTNTLFELNRTEKYTAGLLYILLHRFPHSTKKNRSYLKENGIYLDSFLTSSYCSDSKMGEVKEKAAYFVLSWMDDNKGIFDEVCTDYTTQNSDEYTWYTIQEIFGDLICRFKDSENTRKYIRKKCNDPRSWLKKYFLNGTAFKGKRIFTESVSAILLNLTETTIAETNLKIVAAKIQAMYSLWFPGISLNVVPIKNNPLQNVYLYSLYKNYDKITWQEIRLSKYSKSFEELGRFKDTSHSSLAIISFRLAAFGFAFREYYNSFGQSEQKQKLGHFETIGVQVGLLSMVRKIIKLPIQKTDTPLLHALWGSLLGTIDSVQTICEYPSVWNKCTYELGDTQALSITPSMMKALGYTWIISSSAISTIVNGGNSLRYGVGLSSPVIGLPVGGILIAIDTLTSAQEEIAYRFLTTPKCIQWIQNYQWGNGQNSSQRTLRYVLDKGYTDHIQQYQTMIDLFHSALYSCKAGIAYDEINHVISITISSTSLEAKSRILISSLKIISHEENQELIVRNFVVNQNKQSPQNSIYVAKGEPPTVTISFKHRTRLRGVKKILVKIQIDIFGNGAIIIPERNKTLSVSYPVQV